MVFFGEHAQMHTNINFGMQGENGRDIRKQYEVEDVIKAFGVIGTACDHDNSFLSVPHVSKTVEASAG